MTLVEVLELVYLRTDEDFSDRETSMDKLLKYAINQAYRQIRTKVDKRTTESDVVYGQKFILPSNFFEMIEVKNGTTNLSDLDYDIIGNQFILRNQNITSGNLHLFYINVPTTLVNDTDVIDLRDIYIDALTAYASYVYLLSTGKAEIANFYLTEYTKIITPVQEQGGR